MKRDGSNITGADLLDIINSRIPEYKYIGYVLPDATDHDVTNPIDVLKRLIESNKRKAIKYIDKIRLGNHRLINNIRFSSLVLISRPNPATGRALVNVVRRTHNEAGIQIPGTSARESVETNIGFALLYKLIKGEQLPDQSIRQRGQGIECIECRDGACMFNAIRSGLHIAGKSEVHIYTCISCSSNVYVYEDKYLGVPLSMRHEWCD